MITKRMRGIRIGLLAAFVTAFGLASTSPANGIDANRSCSADELSARAVSGPSAEKRITLHCGTWVAAATTPAPIRPPLAVRRNDGGSGTAAGREPPEYFYAGGEIVSSPKPVNIDGDPRPGIVFGTSNGEVYLLTADGVAASGWPVFGGTAVGYCSAAVADLDGDESEDIVIHANNSLVVYSQGGASLPGWPQTLDQNIYGNSLIGSPVVADIDDDGDPEILVGHYRRMYAFHHDGTTVTGWPIQQQYNFGPLFATPAVADLDGDGKAEICFKIYGGNGAPADIYLLHHDGANVAGWPKLGLDRSHLSSPVFADIDADGALDIVVSLHYYSSGNYVRVYAWKLDGSDIAGFPVGGSWNTTPAQNAVGDVDGDGFLEILVSTTNYTSPYYAVHAWNHDGIPLSGSWPRSAPYCSMDGSPALADVNGGANEVIIGVGGCYGGDAGAMNVWADDGSPLDGWPRFVPGWLRSSALVMDSDGDGVPEIYVGSSDGWVYRFLTEDATGGSDPEWNQIFHDPRNTNSYPLAAGIPGDLNGDGCVDQADLGILLGDWDCTGGDCPGDCDGDGDTDHSDLGILLAHWGEGCP